MADGATAAVSGLESLILTGAAGLILTLVLALVAPVTVKVARGSASMTATTTGAAATTTTAREIIAEAATAVCTNSHALTPAMTTAATAAEGRARRRLAFCGGWGGACTRSLILRLFSGARGARGRELETRRGAFLLSNFGGLLCVGQGQGMTSLMTAAAAAAATTATTTAKILSSLVLRVVEAAKGRPGRPRGGGRRRAAHSHAHTHVGKSRLITAM
jgi:hypothetical protein